MSTFEKQLGNKPCVFGVGGTGRGKDNIGNSVHDSSRLACTIIDWESMTSVHQQQHVHKLLFLIPTLPVKQMKNG